DFRVEEGGGQAVDVADDAEAGEFVGVVAGLVRNDRHQRIVLSLVCRPLNLSHFRSMPPSPWPAMLLSRRLPRVPNQERKEANQNDPDDERLEEIAPDAPGDPAAGDQFHEPPVGGSAARAV